MNNSQAALQKFKANDPDLDPKTVDLMNRLLIPGNYFCKSHEAPIGFERREVACELEYSPR